MSNDTSNIRYVSCDQLDGSYPFRAAQAGFCDYILPFTMTRSEFDSRFWGPEGNIPSVSYVALDDGEPIGLVLSGIRTYDGLMTMRCGMLAVSPEYRGKGVAKDLMIRHAEAAAAHQCDRYYLEVIRGNDRAVSFYRGLGYIEAGIIMYFNFSRLSGGDNIVSGGPDLRRASIEEVAALRKGLSRLHLHWQREMDSLSLSDHQCRILEAGGETAGAVVWNSKVIPFLYVQPAFRRRGLGTFMLNHVRAQLPEGESIMLSFVDNDELERFCLENGGKKDAISQYEMVRPLETGAG